MIAAVTNENIAAAARIHSLSWQESHRAFCSAGFVAVHTPEHQREYIRNKMEKGSAFYMLTDTEPAGVISVTGNLIEDLYVLPELQNRGYGTKLLRFAVDLIREKKLTPVLWILENNHRAEQLYLKNGFVPTGNRKRIADRLDEAEFALTGK